MRKCVQFICIFIALGLGNRPNLTHFIRSTFRISWLFVFVLVSPTIFESIRFWNTNASHLMHFCSRGHQLFPRASHLYNFVTIKRIPISIVADDVTQKLTRTCSCPAEPNCLRALSCCNASIKLLRFVKYSSLRCSAFATCRWPLVLWGDIRLKIKVTFASEKQSINH